MVALNGLCICGAILRNEITVVGPVKYATSVAVEITLANTAQSRNKETIIILMIALKIIATRGILYLSFICPKNFGICPFFSIARNTRPVTATNDTPVPNGETTASI